MCTVQLHDSLTFLSWWWEVKKLNIYWTFTFHFYSCWIRTSNRAGDWFLICIMLYIIWKLVICRTSSTINNYRIYIETREKGKNVLINSGDLIGHRDVTSRISAVYVRSTRWRKFRKEGGGGRTDPKLARYVHPGIRGWKSDEVATHKFSGTSSGYLRFLRTQKHRAVTYDAVQ